MFLTLIFIGSIAVWFRNHFRSSFSIGSFLRSIKQRPGDALGCPQDIDATSSSCGSKSQRYRRLAQYHGESRKAVGHYQRNFDLIQFIFI
jgi:hypothetical protein